MTTPQRRLKAGWVSREFRVCTMFVMGTTALSQNWDTEMENLGLEEQLCSSNWSPALAVI